MVRKCLELKIAKIKRKTKKRKKKQSFLTVHLVFMILKLIIVTLVKLTPHKNCKKLYDKENFPKRKLDSSNGKILKGKINRREENGKMK